MTMYQPSDGPSAAAHLKGLVVAVKRAEIVMSFGALGVAFWHLVLLDRSLLSLAFIAAIPPLIAFFIVWRGKTRTLARSMATLFLLLMSIGGFACSASFPGWQALHHGVTEFADQFNRLDLYSRRMIGWITWLDASFLFYGMGHLVLFTELRRQRAGYRPQISQTTCVLGLCFFWGVAAFMLVGGLAMTVAAAFGVDSD